MLMKVQIATIALFCCEFFIAVINDFIHNLIEHTVSIKCTLLFVYQSSRIITIMEDLY